MGLLPTLWCEKQLTKWMVLAKVIVIDESLYAAQYAAREAAINIMTKAGGQSSTVIKDQLEKHHGKLLSHDIHWPLTKNLWQACCGDQANDGSSMKFSNACQIHHPQMLQIRHQYHAMQNSKRCHKRFLWSSWAAFSLAS